MAKNIELATTVYRVKRTRSTSYGNPMFEFHTTHGVKKIQANTAYAYKVTNDFPVDESINNGDGMEVTLIMTPAHRVTDWRI